MTHLVMVSGGPDSAWCLRYVLLTTDAPAIALRVEILDAGGRAPFETRAFARICDLLERIRPIERITCGLTVPLSCVAADWALIRRSSRDAWPSSSWIAISGTRFDG